MNVRQTTWIILTLAATGLAGAADPPAAGPGDLLRKAAAIRPTAEESRWMTIPWQTSAVAAERLAREEKRPILYWNVDDDPLDRC